MDMAVKFQSKLTDEELISSFVEYLSKNGRPGITVTDWPDKRNRQSSDIDAIAGSLAIEHSSVDTIPNQRRDSAWFARVVAALEDEFNSKLPFRLSVTFPYEAIQTGQDWSEITSALRDWLLNEAPKLEMGSHIVLGAIGIPFEFRVMKKNSNRNGLLFSRMAPNDQTFPNRLKKQLDQKIDKLSLYKDKTTILLVESDDVALMNDGIMWEGLRSAYPNGMPNGLDEIWFADTSIPEEIIFTNMTKAVDR
jgi:hypothetical protein